MRWFGTLVSLLAGLLLAGCTSDADAPVNQNFPIKQMDGFFDSLSGTPQPSRSASVPDYQRMPGYAPAYPPYQP